MGEIYYKGRRLPGSNLNLLGLFACFNNICIFVTFNEPFVIFFTEHQEPGKIIPS